MNALSRIVTPVPLLLIVHTLLLANCGWHQSPTLNEPSHLAAGLSIWSTGRFSVYKVNPPLVKLVASLPVALCDYDGDFTEVSDGPGVRQGSAMGAQFIFENGNASMFYFRLSRLFVLPFSLLGACVCFLWARDAYECKSAGILACALWSFSPMVLGNASLIAPDAHSAALGLAACYTFWRWLRRPTLRQAILTGIVLGLAELSKTTLVVFFPLWPILWVAYRWQDRNTMTTKQWINEAGMLVVRMAVGLYVLNLGYLGNGSFTQLKEYQFVSQLCTGENDASIGNRFANSWLGEVPIPFPRDYVEGIDIQQKDFENFPWPSYLRGHYQETGWWYFYAYASLVKSPLGTLGLIIIACVSLALRRSAKLAWRDCLVLLGPAILIFVIASCKSGFSHHARYILPCLPFFFVWLGGQACHVDRLVHYLGNRCDRKPAQTLTSALDKLSWLFGSSVIVCTSWMIVSSLSIYPHSLSYFNEAVGGPRNGPEHLIKSSIDWGQDLFFLQDWIDSNPMPSPVYLAFDNYYNPFDLQIPEFEPWPFGVDQPVAIEEIPDGYYAISVNLLYEFPWEVYARDGSRYFIDPRPMGNLRGETPIGWAGYSIRVYSADQIRRAYKAEPTKLLWDQSR